MACGFHLRGERRFTCVRRCTSACRHSPLAIDLKRNIRAVGSTEWSTQEGADAVLEVLAIRRRPYQDHPVAEQQWPRARIPLGYSLNFRVLDKAGKELLAPTSIC
jgi:LPS-assembly lipoprotein